MHFQTWQDKAGNATPLTEYGSGKQSTWTFTTLSELNGETKPGILNGDTLQSNLIIARANPFPGQEVRPVAIIRRTSTAFGGAVASVQSFVTDGLFINPKTNKSDTGIVRVLMRLAEEPMRPAAVLGSRTSSSNLTDRKRAVEALGPRPFRLGPLPCHAGWCCNGTSLCLDPLENNVALAVRYRPEVLSLEPGIRSGATIPRMSLIQCGRIARCLGGWGNS